MIDYKTALAQAGETTVEKYLDLYLVEDEDGRRFFVTAMGVDYWERLPGCKVTKTGRKENISTAV